jgi:hypothetical protein
METASILARVEMRKLIERAIADGTARQVR